MVLDLKASLFAVLDQTLKLTKRASRMENSMLNATYM